jgi:hypothetical protein
LAVTPQALVHHNIHHIHQEQERVLQTCLHLEVAPHIHQARVHHIHHIHQERVPQTCLHLEVAPHIHQARVPELQIAHHWELEKGNQNPQIHQVRVLQKFEEQTKCQMKMRHGKYRIYCNKQKTQNRRTTIRSRCGSTAKATRSRCTKLTTWSRCAKLTTWSRPK